MYVCVCVCVFVCVCVCVDIYSCLMVNISYTYTHAELYCFPLFCVYFSSVCHNNRCDDAVDIHKCYML